MSTAVLIFIIIAVLLLLVGIGIGIYFAFFRKTKPPPTTQPPSSPGTQPPGNGGSVPPPGTTGCTGTTGWLSAPSNISYGAWLNNLVSGPGLVNPAEGVTNLNQCQQACESLNSSGTVCNFVGFSRESQRCFLYRFTDTPNSVVNVELTGNTPGPWTRYNGKSFPGNTSSTATLRNETECATFCRSGGTPPLIISDFNSSNNVCTCKGGGNSVTSLENIIQPSFLQTEVCASLP